jgi:hypothetical protein
MFTLTLIAAGLAVAFLVALVYHAIDMAKWHEERKSIKARGHKVVAMPYPRRKVDP